MERLKQFECMLAEIQRQYALTVEQMERLKAEGKTRSVTYREAMGNKLTFQMMLELYRSYGLIE